MNEEEVVKFWTPSLPDPDAEFFEGFFSIARWGIFRQIGSYLWTNWSDLHENFTTNVTSDKEAPVKFWKSSGFKVCIQSPDMDSGSGPNLPLIGCLNGEGKYLRELHENGHCNSVCVYVTVVMCWLVQVLLWLVNMVYHVWWMSPVLRWSSTQVWQQCYVSQSISQLHCSCYNSG